LPNPDAIAKTDTQTRQPEVDAEAESVISIMSMITVKIQMFIWLEHHRTFFRFRGLRLSSSSGIDRRG